MDIKEWEVWHTYSSYLQMEPTDLGPLVHTLVENGLAIAVMHRDGECAWRSQDGKVGKGHATVELDVSRQAARVQLPGDVSGEVALDGFAREALIQATRFRFSELRLLSDSLDIPAPYIRAYLGECHLVQESSNHRTVVYPTVVLYETGVVLVELRTLSPEGSTNLSAFIDGATNLFQIGFDRIYVPPGLAVFATRAWGQEQVHGSFRGRLALGLLQRGHDLAIAQQTITSEGGDFRFALAPLSRSEGSAHRETLSKLSMTVIHSIRFVMARPRRGIRFLLLGQKKLRPMGKFWTGRPHTYLVDFDGRRETADENLQHHQLSFASILNRQLLTDPLPAIASLPADGRPFQDYNSFVSEASTLWVWSGSGVRSQVQRADGDRGHLIYEPQVMVELLEYGYMLHQALLETVVQLRDQEAVVAAQRNLIELDAKLERASKSGELREWLRVGWERYGLERLRARVKDSLVLRESRVAMYERTRNQRTARALTIFFGFASLPTVIDQILKPVWILLDLPRPRSTEGFTLFLAAVGSTVVGALVAFVLRYTRGKRS